MQKLFGLRSRLVRNVGVNPICTQSISTNKDGACAHASNGTAEYCLRRKTGLVGNGARRHNGQSGYGLASCCHLAPASTAVKISADRACSFQACHTVGDCSRHAAERCCWTSSYHEILRSQYCWHGLHPTLRVCKTVAPPACWRCNRSSVQPPRRSSTCAWPS